jgi:hypothetical protein
MTPPGPLRQGSELSERLEMSTSEDESEEEITLLDILQKQLVLSKFDKTPHRFIPEGVLARILTEECILDSMSIRTPNIEDKSIVDFISKKARKLFGISIFCEFEPKKLRSAMALFKDGDFDDNQLPVREARANATETGLSESSASTDSSVAQNYLASFEHSVKPFKRKPRIWNDIKWEHFSEYQWRFLAPVFSATTFNHDFSVLHIMPFTKRYSGSDKGSFGQIFQYEIHPDHIDDTLISVSELI